MNRLNLMCGITLACLGLLALGCSGGDTAPAAEDTAAQAEAPSDAPPAAEEEAEGEEERPRFISPIRGVAELAYLAPDTNVVKGEVVTIIQVQNRATAPIAGLKVDEYWWDESGNPLPGDSQRLRQPLMSGAVATIELRVPHDSRDEPQQLQLQSRQRRDQRHARDGAPGPRRGRRGNGTAARLG